MTQIAYVMSEEDARIIREFLREMRRNPRPAPRYLREPELGQSPEVYLARTPAGGIPARVGTTPGSATCTIYRLLNGQLSVSSVRSLVVYNPCAGEAFAGNVFTPIERDKFGTWWVSAPCSDDDVPGTGTGTGFNAGTGTGTGFDPDCAFSFDELESIAGDGLAVDFSEDCPKLITQTTPPECVAVVVYETDLRCETATGTGTSQEGSLNLYRREVSLSIEHGCPTISRGDWVFVKAVACCDPECTFEERFWWCINDNADGSGNGDVTPGDDCESAPELSLDTEYGPFTFAGGVLVSKWFKFPTGLSGTHKATVVVSAIDNDGSGAVIRVWPGNDCDTLGMGNSDTIMATGTFCVAGTPATEMWFEVDLSGLTATGSMTFTVTLAAGAC